MIEGDEVCDDGDANALEPGACAPNCSTIIETKILKGSAAIDDTNFGPNPVAFADSLCAIGYAAMFVYGNERVATTVAWQSVGSVDWPIQPYTAYVNNMGKLIWVTDDTRLLAVRNGQKQAPINPLYQCNPCIASYMVSGMAANGTNALSNTCDGWTSTDPNASFSVGDYFTFDTATMERACSADLPPIPSVGFLCVEQ